MEVSIHLFFHFIFRSYFWGYFVSQIPGARVAENFSAKYVMLFSVAINVFCTILTPLAAEEHYVYMIVMRILEGMQNFLFFSNWNQIIRNSFLLRQLRHWWWSNVSSDARDVGFLGTHRGAKHHVSSCVS